MKKFTAVMNSIPKKKGTSSLTVLLLILFLVTGAFVQSAKAVAPTITSFTPSSGAVGTLVTITGTNLGSPTAFTIGGTSAIVVSNSGTTLVGMVMPGATTGAISVTTSGGTATATGNFTVTATPYPAIQQGDKMVGTGAVGSFIDTHQGCSVALSADGNTAIVGGKDDDWFDRDYYESGKGAVWIYTRTGDLWSQQGNKLVGTGGSVDAAQGYSVSLSADGNTALVGGLNDNNFLGAAWVFVRSNNGTWSQQGKLVGNGAVGNALMGTSVSLSADGNTAIIGGKWDNSMIGAAWVFVRSNNGSWTQKGDKLVGTGNTGTSQQGCSVSLSADGNTAIVGGSTDNSNQGAAWVFTYNGTTWSQQSKLVGTGNTGAAQQGVLVSLSADGNTAIVGGSADNSNQGAAWVFTRSGSTWSQQGDKLVGTGNTGAAQQGRSVSLTADGNTAMVGGYFDSGYMGAAWVFTRSGNNWSQQGSKLVGTGNSGNARQGGSVFVSANGTTAIVGGYFDNSQAGAAWMFVAPPPPPTITSFTPSSGPVGTLVTITGTNLGSPTAFTIGGTAAIVVSNSGTTLVGMVMPGATTGAISVTTAGGTATATGNFTVTPTPYPSAQQGDKLFGTGAVGGAQQGNSVAVSADGNTAVVGGPMDDNGQGAAWIYTRSENTWSQQEKIVGTGNTGRARQGTSVAISADGNTAVVGGSQDNAAKGAVWVFTRSGTTWSQQGLLVGTGNVGRSLQGSSVAVSADGNTVIAGGQWDNSGIGASWVFTRSGTTWSEQGKLVGSGNVGMASQGFSVAISADGNTAIVGGPNDNDYEGAAWTYTRSGNTWSQQEKLVGTGNTGAAQQGTSVAISADGNTAVMGGTMDNNSQGAVWVFTRSGGSWSQQAGPLAGTGFVGASSQGSSVGLSADGNTAIIGGQDDNTRIGATWVFTRSGSTWTQQGEKLIGSGSVGEPYQGYSAALSADGKTLIVGGNNDNTFNGAAWVFVPPPPPTITSFTPSSGAVGTLVTITGTGFTGATAVSFGGTAAGTFTVVSSTSITATVGSGTSGSVSVTNAGGTASKTGFTYINPPTNLNFSNTKTGSDFNIVVNYTASATADGYLVVRRAGSAPAFVPVDGTTYTPGTQGSDQIVYAGTATTCTDAAVTAGTTHNYAIYAYKGSGSSIVYLSASPLTGNTILYSASPGAIASSGTSPASAGFPNSGVNASFPGGTTGTTLTVAKTAAAPASNLYVLPGVKGIKSLYFTISSGNPTPGGYTLVLDFSDLGLTQDKWANFKVLKRTYATSPWVDVTTIGATIVSRQTDGVWGKFTISGLSSFSEFALGESFDGAIVSNLAATSSGTVVGNDQDYIAQAFTTNETKYDLLSAKLSIEIGGANAILKLYGALSNGEIDQAGGALVTFGSPSQVSSTVDWQFTPSSPATYTLLANTTYWLVFHASASPNDANFNYTDDMSSSGPGTIPLTNNNAQSGDGGNTYTYYDNSPYMFSVMGNIIPTTIITSFTPTSAAPGATVTITGNNFSGASAVSFGGTAATSYTVVDENTITAVIAGGATGSVCVTATCGTATSTDTFTFIPAPSVEWQAGAWLETQPAGNADKAWKCVAVSANGTTMLAGIVGGRLYMSKDGGTSWLETQPAGASDKIWEPVSVSGDGLTMLAGVNGGRLFKSTDGGTNWSETQPAGASNVTWKAVSVSGDGQNMLAGAQGGRLYKSTDGGTSWSETQPAGNTYKNWYSVSVSGDGFTMLAGIYDGRLYKSTDSGTSWSETQPAGNAIKKWTSLTVSGDGQTMLAIELDQYGQGRLYKSLNGGTNWSETQPAGNTTPSWSGVSVSADGQKMLASASYSRLYLSTDGGTSWSETQPAGAVNKNWGPVAVSGDGTTMLAPVYNGRLYLSSSTIFNPITANTASATANITATNGADASNRGAIWYPYTDSDKIIGGEGVTDVSNPGTFTATTYPVSFTDLTPNTRYNSRAHATNPSGTGYSARTDFRTLANVPAAPTVNNATATTLDVAVNVNGNPSTTEFCINETTTNQYVQANGGLSTSTVWQTATTWGTKTVTGLTTGNTYTFKVKARNGDNVETAYSATTNGIPVGPPSVEWLANSGAWLETQPAGESDKNWCSVSVSGDGMKMLAGVQNGRLYLSTNGGTSWSETQPAGAANKFWKSVSVSGNGQNMLAGVQNGRLYLSTDGGTSWSETQPDGATDKVWTCVSVSGNGLTMLAGLSGGRLYKSSDGGTNWSEAQPAGNSDKNWVSVAASGDGITLLAAVSGGRLYKSSDGGTNWSETQPAGESDLNWQAVAVSSNGMTTLAGVAGGRLYKSTDGGTSWSETQPEGESDLSWLSISVSGDGQKMLAGVFNGRLYKSTDGGTNWSETQPAGPTNQYWYSISVSGDGQIMLAPVYNGRLFMSSSAIFKPVTASTASATANITATNGADATNRGAIWYPYTDSDKIIGGEGVTDVSNPGTFTATTYPVSFTDLTPNTRYNSRAHATNPSGTGYSARTDFRTLANVPDAPTVNNATATTLDVAVNVNGNPELTEFCINETTTNQYVQANGGLSTSTVWQTATTWGTKTVTGLTTGNTYTFKVKARNGDNVETAYGATTDGTPVDKPSIAWEPLGTTWLETQPAGALDQNWASVSVSVDGQIMLAGVMPGRLYRSTDGGTSWSETQPAGAADNRWNSVSVSGDGQIMLAGVLYGRLYKSTDGGTNWSEAQPAGAADKFWKSVSVSGDGLKMLACVQFGRLYMSTDGGANWSETQPAGEYDKNWKSVSVSGDGSKMLACIDEGRFYKSTDGGTSWSETQPAGNADKRWNSVSVSGDGQIMLAGVYDGRLYKSTDGGTSWSETQPAGASDKKWAPVSVSGDGQIMLAGVYYGRLYKSTDGGTSWNEAQPAGASDKQWGSVSVSGDGTKLLAGVYGGRLYNSAPVIFNPITATTALASGNITATNGADASNRGAIWYPYTDSDKIIGGEGVTDVSNPGTFTATTYPVSFTGLSVNTRYNSRAHATNPYGTGYSVRTDFWTLANVPDAPTVNNATATTLDVAVNVNGNPSTTEFCINETSTSMFVQANGKLGVSAVWQTSAIWDTKTVTELATGSTYTFQVKARNGDLVETTYGATASGTTCTNPTSGGTISEEQAICSGTTPNAFTSVSPASGHGGTLEYKWQSSAESSSSGFSDIESATETTYAPGALTQTTWFKRLAKVTCKEDWTGAAESNVLSVTVYTIPTATMMGTTVVCRDVTAPEVTFTGANGTALYRFAYTYNYGSTQTVTTISGNSVTVAQTTATPGTFTYTLLRVTDAHGCTQSQEGTVIITVNPTGQVNQPENQTICNNRNTALITFGTVNTGGNTTYHWINDAPSIGLSAEGSGDIASFQVYNPGAAPVIATIAVTPTFTNEAVSCVGPTKTFTITVNPTAQVNQPESQLLCNGSTTTAVHFGTILTGGTTTYSWTNSQPGIGLGAQGAGDVPSFVATNYGTAPVVAMIVVTPTFNNNGVNCSGPSKSFTITVNPTGQVNQPASQVVCNNATTALVTFGTTNTGGTTTYIWTNDNTGTGLGAQGLGDIPGFIATNTGAAPVVATITVTPIFTNGGLSCTGPARSFTITVNPTGQVNQPGNQLLCNGSNTTAITFGTANTGGTTTYSWTNDNTGTGLGAQGTGNIPAFTATNSGAAPVVATIVVTPTFTNGGVTCSGPSKSFTITVNPTGQVNQPASQVVCNGATTILVTFGTANTGGTTTYTWTNSLTSIGLVEQGTGNIPAFTATNSGSAPVVATILVTPTFTNGQVSCTGPTKSFTITVNPTAQVNQPGNQLLCNGSNTTEVTFGTISTGGTTSYSWTNNTTSIGLVAQGTGNIPAFTATNSTAAPVVATIVVTPTFTNGGVSCSGLTKSFTITVNPSGQVNQPDNQVVCNNTSTSLVTFSTTSTGGTTSYSWTNSLTSIGLGAQGTGNIPAFTATNTGTSPVVATIVVTPTFTNGSVNCSGPSKSFTITVNPTGQVNQPDDQFVCNNASTSLVAFGTTRTGGTTSYSWTNDNTGIGLRAQGTGDIGAFTATNPGASPVVATIVVTPTFTNGSVSCTGPSKSFTITVNPSLPVGVSIEASANNRCAGSVVGYTATPVNAGINPLYQWKVNGNNVGTNSPAYVYIPLDGDVVTCVLTVVNPEGCFVGGTAISNAIQMRVYPYLEVGVSITSSANPVCTGTPVTFTATTVNGGASPTYQWKVNGTSVGSNSPVYTYIPVNGDQVSCVLTSSEQCAIGNPATSNTLTMAVIPLLPVSVSIVSSANPVCTGTSVSFTATTVNGGSNPVYQWKVNAVNAGDNNPVYTYIPSNGDVITCVLTANEVCMSGNPATSNVITLTVNTLPVPVLTGPVTVVSGATGVVYTTQTGQLNYTWNISEGGTITAGGTTADPTATVTWNTAGAQWISVNYTNTQTGCSGAAATQLNVTVTQAPFIAITSPNGGEAWRLGSVQNITWNDNITGDVTIELFKDGVYYHTIAAATPSTGTYEWTIARNQQPGADYKVKITSVANPALYGMSSSAFTISYDLPINLEVRDIVIPNDLNLCFDALQTISVAGTGHTFVVQPGGSATFIAGQNILYLPGTTVQPGGYMHGYITQTAEYCWSFPPSFISTSVTAVSDTSHASRVPRYDSLVPRHDSLVPRPVSRVPIPVSRVPIPDSAWFTVYPNPTNGKFMVEYICKDQPGTIQVEVFGMKGERILTKEMTEVRKQEFSLEGRANGIYLVRIVADKVTKTVRVLKR